MDYILILGAGSDIAQELARLYAEEGYNLYLASRNLNLLERLAKDLEIRYQIKAKPLFFDATSYETHSGFYQKLEPKPLGVVVAFGYLGDQLKAQKDFNEARKIIETNFLGAVSILEIIAKDFEERKAGFIIGISSVAGERGRQSNYIYGAAKAAFSIYLQGLRNRLYRSGISVLTVKPGFVETKMTASMKLPKLLTASPVRVAQDIIKAWHKKKDEIYTLWIWRYIMFLIRMIPENIGKRLEW
ncbi:MAG: SDR family oxidoreductase [Thermodesulfobacteria bacterium]|nr:SDR family oxidoreductase [Thermodesulfobacteriota bacterium]